LRAFFSRNLYNCKIYNYRLYILVLIFARLSYTLCHFFFEPENLTEDQKQILENSDILISELKQVEIVVFGCPMYNFSISASLKAYFDLCCRSGHTFTYTEKGPQGLLVGKKAVICTTSAGVPSGSEVDFVSSYMKQVCNFIGITDSTLIHANGLMTGNQSEIIKSATNQISLLLN